VKFFHYFVVGVCQGRDVAVKVLKIIDVDENDNADGDTETTDEFNNEAEMLKQCAPCPQILRLYGTIQEEGISAIVMVCYLLLLLLILYLTIVQ